jgi:hypothetical protein
MGFVSVSVGEADMVELETWEMDPELEAVIEAEAEVDMDGSGMDGSLVGALAWLEARPVEEEPETARPVCTRLLVGAAGESTARFFFPKVPAFLTDKPV